MAPVPSPTPPTTRADFTSVWGVDTGRGTLNAVYQGLRQYDAVRSERSHTGDVYALPELARDLGYLRYDGEFEVSGRAVETHAVLSYQRQSELAARQIVARNQLLREQPC